MTAKTNAERQHEFRQRQAKQQATEVRGIFAHHDDHAEVKEAAAKIARRRKRLAKQGAPYRKSSPACAALARLWPVLERAMSGLVFTADRAGEVQADMNTLRAILKRPNVAVSGGCRRSAAEPEGVRSINQLGHAVGR